MNPYQLNTVSDASYTEEKGGGDPCVSICREMLHRVNQENHKKFWGEMLQDITSELNGVKMEEKGNEDRIISHSVLQPMHYQKAYVIFDKHSCPRDAKYVKIFCPSKNSIMYQLIAKHEKTKDDKSIELYLLYDASEPSSPVTYADVYQRLKLKDISSLTVQFLQ